ncbi:MAG: sulfurtransferase TusA family protein [Acidimicrobiales bacterium]
MIDDGHHEVVDRWDAGDMGCGELIIELRRRLAPVPPGALFELVARDAGAPEDLPSWCRMTGHELMEAQHPVYLIRRRLET